MCAIERAVMDAYDKTSIQINRCKRILALVDTYVETETASARTDLRKALMEEFEAPAIAPPVAAGSVDTEELRRLAFNATRGPWHHTRQGVVVAGPFRQYTNGAAQSQIASFCVTSHEEDDEHQTEKQVPNALFSAAAYPDAVLALIERAEKAEAERDVLFHRLNAANGYLAIAEARVKELEVGRQSLQAEGKHPAPCASSCEARAFQSQARERDAHIEELEAQLVLRRAPLSPETQQAIAAARAAGQSIAATSAGLVFMSDGAEPGSGELDCPACGGSGHSSDVVARSAP